MQGRQFEVDILQELASEEGVEAPSARHIVLRIGVVRALPRQHFLLLLDVVCILISNFLGVHQILAYTVDNLVTVVGNEELDLVLNICIKGALLSFEIFHERITPIWCFFCREFYFFELGCVNEHIEQHVVS